MPSKRRASRLDPNRLDPIWRLGHRSAPCAYPPRHLCAWRNRFDDPQRKYRTLYGARDSLTCLRELLADLRPNASALTEMEELFGDPTLPALAIAGVVSYQWRRANVLVRTKIVSPNGQFAKMEDKHTLIFLRQEHASLLAGFGIQTLHVRDVRTKERIITQQFSRTLYDTGNAGIAFFSRLDGKPCYALFEGRAVLRPVAASIPMTQDWPDLIRVCGEYNLILRPASKLPQRMR